MKVRAEYIHRREIFFPDAVIVLLVDCDGPVSVTNDAEAIVAEVFDRDGPRRIFYKDTEGHWDELVHDLGVFKRFGALDDAMRKWCEAHHP